MSANPFKSAPLLPRQTLVIVQVTGKGEYAQRAIAHRVPASQAMLMTHIVTPTLVDAGVPGCDVTITDPHGSEWKPCGTHWELASFPRRPKEWGAWGWLTDDPRTREIVSPSRIVKNT